jgi:DinB family protein
MTNSNDLRVHVVELLRGGHAHVTFDDAVADVPPPVRGKRPDSLPYSPWELVEHIRIAQRDILDYSVASDAKSYTALPWPKGYWPQTPAPPDARSWDKSIDAIRADREAMELLVKDPANDLFAMLPAATEGQTLLREALLLADHTSYHIGELIAVRRLLNAWR